MDFPRKKWIFCVRNEFPKKKKYFPREKIEFTGKNGFLETEKNGFPKREKMDFQIEKKLFPRKNVFPEIKNLYPKRKVLFQRKNWIS